MMKENLSVSLDDLARGNLPNHVSESIGKLKISIEELTEWKKSHPPIYIAFERGDFVVEVKLRWSIKKFITITGGIIGSIWIILQFFIDYLPKIKEWFSNYS